MPTALSPETESRIAILRQKAQNGTFSLEDSKEAIALLRQDRKAAMTASTAKKTKAAKVAIPDADALMAELGVEI